MNDLPRAVFSTALSLQDDIPFVKKEIYDGTYSLAAHVLAKQVVLYPNSAMWSIVFCILVLASTRLASTVGMAVLIILVNQASVFLFQGVGFLISAGVPSSGLLVLCVLVVSYFYAFNGFFAPYALMPAWYQWLRWPGLMTYPYQLVMHLTFGNSNVIYSCNQAPLLSSYPTCINSTSPSIDGQQVLEQWDIDLSPGVNIAVILVSALIIRMAVYYVYLFRMRPPKGLGEASSASSRFSGCRRLCSRKAIGAKHDDDSSSPAEVLPTATVPSGEKDNSKDAEDATTIQGGRTVQIV